MPSIKSLSAAPALLAALSLTAMPVQAAELPAPAAPVTAQFAPAWMPGDDDAAGHRRYRHRRDRGVDAGDVLAGILIIGGIAAIANAAKGSSERYPTRDSRYPEPRRGGVSYDDGRGIDRAVDMCVEEIERNARVETVDAVNRDARGWTVSGALYDGQGFNCTIGADGRIESIGYGTGGSSYDSYGSYDDAARLEGEDRQYDDAYYAAMRARSDSAQPAYPGGPLPGDEDAVDADLEYGTGYRGAER